MLRKHALTTIIAIAAGGLLVPASAGPDTAAQTGSGEFRIMSPEEIDTHVKAMQELQGEARESYRNAEYRKLRDRADANGYSMPEVPPWQIAQARVTDTVTASTAATGSEPAEQPAAVVKEAAPTAQDTAKDNTPDLQRAARQQRELIEDAVANRPALPKAEPGTDGVDSAEVAQMHEAQNSANAEYRKTMRQRFDQFMAERQSELDKRRQEIDEQRAREARERQQAAYERMQQLQVPPRPPYMPAPPPLYPPYGVPPYWHR